MSARAEQLLATCRQRGLRIATAESCTGGMVAAALTDIGGSSDVFERGFVTYSNTAKKEMLGVSAELLNLHGAVSREVAMAMAEGALVNSKSSLAIAVTGIAGPTGGSAAKPVGLVHFSIAILDMDTIHNQQIFRSSDRNEIRRLACGHAIDWLWQTIETLNP